MVNRVQILDRYSRIDDTTAQTGGMKMAIEKHSRGENSSTDLELPSASPDLMETATACLLNTL